MSSQAKATTASIIPTFRYRDAPAAIEFLCRAFGFERHLVVPGEDGTIVHAQLRFGNGMIMDIEDKDYGGRGYTCRDPEGYVWSFGGYDPWAAGA
jgi:uncharacterized glyoxalase superfamily protein PhnB